MWVVSPHFKRVIAANWHMHVNGTPMYRLVCKETTLNKHFRYLNKDIFEEAHAKYIQVQQDLFDSEGYTSRIPQ